MDKKQFSNIFFHRQSILLLPIAFFVLCFIDAMYGYLADPLFRSGTISTIDFQTESKKSNQQDIILTLDNDSTYHFRIPVNVIQYKKETISKIQVDQPVTIYFAPAFLGQNQKDKPYEVLKLLIEGNTIVDIVRIAKGVSFNLMLIYGILSLILISYYLYRLRMRLEYGN